MDFVDPVKKRRHARRLLLTYVFIAAVIAGGTLLLGLESFGYHFNRKSGELVQNGLIFVASRPGGAEIRLNGEPRSERTDTRLDLPADDYSITLQRDGYRSWQHDITLVGGSIERLVYPVLFPVDIVTKDVELYRETPTLVTQSPDRRWLIVSQADSLTEFELYDLNQTNPSATALTLPDGLLTASQGEQRLRGVEWSSDNRRVLLEHTYSNRSGKQREFIMLDWQSPTSSFNLNKRFNTNPTQVALRDKRFDRFYFYDAARLTLRTADFSTRRVSPLLEKVLNFKVHGDDQVLYATTKSAGVGSVNVNLRTGDDDYTIKRLPDSKTYRLDMAQFDGRWYVAIGAGQDGPTYIYEDPVETLRRNRFRPLEPTATLQVDGVSKLSFSANARFIAVQGGNAFAVHDFETKRGHNYTLEDITLEKSAKATWMDGHRLTLLSQGKAIVFDYDGTNLQTLAPAASYQPYFSSDYNTLYTIAPSPTVPTRPALLRGALEVK